MSLKHHDIEIPIEKPFQNCKLNRAEYANVLTSVIENYPEGFVLAINSKWGTGKTTFIKMWNQQLLNLNYKTIYFNVWENDFENSALTALLGELNILKKGSTEKQFKSVLEKAAKISKHLIPTIVKATAERYVDTEAIANVLSDTTKGVTEIFEKNVEEYSKRKQSIKEFKVELSKFVAKTSNSKPLIFIIDELDRCRPDYAVSILEQVKHFFSVPNIVFILSIDKEQLGNAICGVYGSDNIDSEEYLKRFLDIEYSLPLPERDLFYKYLYDYYDFDKFLVSTERMKFSELNRDKDGFLTICNVLFGDGKTTLRQQEKIFSHSRLALRSFSVNQYLVPSLYLFLVYLKIVRPQFYNGIDQKTLSLKQLQDQFLEVVRNSVNEDSKRQIIWLETYLLNSYNNYLNYPHRGAKLYEWENNTIVPKISSVIDTSSENIDFKHALESINRGSSDIGSISVEHLLKKINLVERFK